MSSQSDSVAALPEEVKSFFFFGHIIRISALCEAHQHRMVDNYLYASTRRDPNRTIHTFCQALAGPNTGVSFLEAHELIDLLQAHHPLTPDQVIAHRARQVSISNIWQPEIDRFASASSASVNALTADPDLDAHLFWYALSGRYTLSDLKAERSVRDFIRRHHARLHDMFVVPAAHARAEISAKKRAFETELAYYQARDADAPADPFSGAFAAWSIADPVAAADWVDAKFHRTRASDAAIHGLARQLRRRAEQLEQAREDTRCACPSGLSLAEWDRVCDTRWSDTEMDRRVLQVAVNFAVEHMDREIWHALRGIEVREGYLADPEDPLERFLNIWENRRVKARFTRLLEE
ncbi:hypothetical protein B0T22DRAFT_484414 [Podospora appendiculata]|uniref:Uncharacterized protein n=1 Tax=Podospora appendiculata TaxID=314037 RepID=A0AAE0X0J4_9PEZI|nr:hypothetical protein B0T22DRAFT_484414 [Podospora appendiculata]